MRAVFRGAVLIGIIAAMVTLVAAAAPVRTASGGTWGKAEEIPGFAVLNTGGFAHLDSVSCASAGNCSAVGQYANSTGDQAFVASQANGAWGKAIEVPGTAALNKNGFAGAYSVSCASAGNCSAGGNYTDGFGIDGHGQAFAVGEVNGTWEKAIEVPGLAALNQGGEASISSVSCASAGNCSAGGFYIDSSGHTQAFIVSEKNGTWGKAIEVPGTAALNQGLGAAGGIGSVSCSSPGNCSASGTYIDSAGRVQAFVVSQANGTWRKAIEVPGTGALGQGENVSAVSTPVSCGSAGNCSAGGNYVDSSGHTQAFVAVQVNGTWRKAHEVPGTAALNQGGEASISSVSCASAGNCSAGGFYVDSSGHTQAFVVTEKDGTWGAAREVPGTAALNTGGHAAITSVSCAAAGDCSAIGNYAGTGALAFVVGEVNGSWGKAAEVPGLTALSQGSGGAIGSVSCASVSHCSAGGQYSPRDQAFVVSEK